MMSKSARIFLFALIPLFFLFLPLFPLLPLSPLFSSIFPYPAFAASPGAVVINEIMWMGSSASTTADEWIELYNNTPLEINLSGWTLKAVDDTPTITLSGKIASNSFYLLERTDDTTVSDLPADQIYTGGLGNYGENLVLRDSTNTTIDEVACSEGWFAGKASPDYISMERIDPEASGSAKMNWNSNDGVIVNGKDANGDSLKGTPKAQNSVYGKLEGGEEDEDKEATYSAQIFLNEIMPDPEGSDTEGEYLELYNAGDKEVNLDGWKIGVGDGAPKIVGDDIELSSYVISGGGFLVIYRKDSHTVLNNKGDTVKLLNPNDEIVDEVPYPEIKEGWVYQRYPDGDPSWSESNQPTAEAKNKPSSEASSLSTSKVDVGVTVGSGELKVNKAFDVKIEIKNAKPLHDYYVKIRLGLEEGKLSDGRTYNSFDDSWLADNASWSKFPIIYTASDGTESITVSAKVASGNSAGTYIIGVRIRDKETEDNFDSATQTIDVGEEPPDLPSEALAKEGAEGTGAVLGTLTELPATGGGLFDSVVTNLFVKFWLPVLGWMLLIFLGSSTPGTSVSESRIVDFAAHKVVHVFEYSVLFILVHRAVKKSFSLANKTLLTTLSFLLTVSYAITDELHQLFVRGRDARLTDVLIDAGAALLSWFMIKKKSILHFFIFSSLTFLTSHIVFAKDILSLTVPDGYELKEGEVDHLASTIEVFNTRGAAINFRPNFNFDLAGFGTFVYSYEKYYGALDPMVFELSIYEGLMEHANLDTPLLSRASPLITAVVEGKAGEAPNYELFFGFEPLAVKGGSDYTAILTVNETKIGRYRFWLRSQYQDGFALTFNPQTRKFSNPSGGSVGAPFGLYVKEGWRPTPPRFHPVVLIHGMGGKPSDWQLPEQDYVSLIRQMYATDTAFDYPSGWIHLYHYGYDKQGVYNYQGDIREIALGLEAVVDDLAKRYAESFGETLESLESRDEDRVVDVVSYSMGGLVARQYLVKHQDNHHIRKLITIAAPHEGIYWLARKEGVGTLPKIGPDLEEAISEAFDMTIAALDKTGQSVSSSSVAALQMTPDSEFLGFLNIVEWTPLDVSYFTIYGDIDINLKQKVFFFTLEKKVSLGDVLVFSESATGIPAVEPVRFGYNEEWTFPVGMAISLDGASAKFYLESLDITKFRFWHLNILHQPEIKDKTVSILANGV